MLGYQHAYHAGAIADVIKHLALTRIINYMIIKDKPLLYLETHAGRGLYDLRDAKANKTAEYRQGISLLWAEREQVPEVFTPYMSALKKLNNTDSLTLYPGSPWLAINGLRTTDRIICCELHTTEFDYLTRLSTAGKRVFFSNEDGNNTLASRLPPLERRGLIFIDPSFEIKTDYKLIPSLLKSAYSRFSTGTYCLWYPLINHYLHEQLLRGLDGVAAEQVLRIEFYWTAEQKAGMTGCGLWIINPPYTLAADMKIALDYLATLFNPGKSSWLIK